MKILDRYIAKTVLAAIGLVTLLLAGLQIFILFVNQLDDLGRGDFGIIQGSYYVLLQMPYQVYLFFPMASLLGCLIGLGMMANHRELIVMRAAGMSIARITLAVFKASLLLIFLVTAFGETLVPRLAYHGNNIKMQALSAGQALRTAHGVWMRYQNDFISIGAVMPDNSLRFVQQYRFDDNHQMVMARQIDFIDYQNGIWQAHNINETYLGEFQTTTKTMPTMIWDVAVKPSLLNISGDEPDEMTLPELHQYLRAQQRNHQNALNYQLAYWQRIFQPLTTVVMMIIAIPFVFGPLRSSTMGAKLLAGAVVGFGFHIVNRFLGPVSQVLQWPPLVAALGPTLIFALVGVYLMRRVR